MTAVLVAGGGLSGAAAAAALAQSGVPVTLIERTTGPTDKICGEFLSAEAAASLAALGLNVANLGGAPISHVRLVRADKVVTAALPFAGLGLSRRVLDEALLQHAAASGAQVIRGHAIRAIDSPAATLDVAGLGALTGPALLLATGKHELRGARRDTPHPNHLVGFKMYFQLAASAQAALRRHVELIMFPGGYAGLQMVEDERANLCLLVHKSRLSKTGGWDGLLAWLRETSPHLASRLAGAAPLLPAPLTIAAVPYGFIHRAPGPDNIYRLGDQAAVIQSFTGDGMAIALHSAALAADAVLRKQTATAYHRQLASDVAWQIRRAGAIYGLGNAPLLQPALFRAAALWPAALALAATVTRVKTPVAA